MSSVGGDYAPLASTVIPSYGATEPPGRDGGSDVAFLDAGDRPEIEKQLLRKLDRRVAFLVLVSIMNYLDRYNAAAARLRGLEEDLDMKGRQFNSLTSILYVGYVLMQTPSNMILSQIPKPSLYLALSVFGSGAFSISTGQYIRFSGALASRFCLGFCEAAFYPGSMFLLSKWYKPNELGWRVAIITSGSTISYAFGALIASAVMEMMDGVFGFAGWRWLFLLEGVVTVIVAVLGVFIIPDFPSAPASWLTAQEHALARKRMEEEVLDTEANDTTADKRLAGIVQALRDWRVWWLSIALGSVYASQSFSNFFPTLSATMGYTPTISLLLCAPPWLLGTAVSFVVTWHSDSSGERFWHIVFPLLIGIIGFVLAMSTMSTSVRYLSLFFMTQATVSIELFMVWVSNSFSQSPDKRAVALAFINAVAMCANIGASYFWPTAWGPSYFKSYLLCVLASVVAIAMFWHYRSHLRGLNEAAEEVERVENLPKGFRYLL
ncbi:MFS general substrate transporter [Phlebopus sp. FC_14]|nr:MFS general substrate transporter [Phlebopus sp. FC_14]